MEERIIPTSQLRELIGEKKSFKELGLSLKEVPQSGFEFRPANPDFIEPSLEKIAPNQTFNGQPQIILISAAGATGKTQMCKHLSSELGIPVLDLGISQPVALNSLSGTLLKSLTIPGLDRYNNALASGQQAMIIDALDEGFIKAGVEAFKTFIEDVKTYTFPDVTTVIMLGRTQTLELTARILSELDIKWEMYQISSFSESQASNYVDQKVKPNEKYIKPYEQLKTEIFRNLNSFFRDQTALRTSFLGYAPVLDAISDAIKVETNYNLLYQKVKDDNKSGMAYVVGIMRYLTDREKNDKIKPLLIEPLRDKLTPAEYEKAMKEGYNDLDQCKAVMAEIYNEPLEFEISAHPPINDSHRKGLTAFIKQHPFLKDGKFQNIVFEAYVLARLMHDDPENIHLLLYLNEKYKPTFMLFYMYHELYNEEEIRTEFISSLYQSLLSFDTVGDAGECDIQEIDATAGKHVLLLGRDNDSIHARFWFLERGSKTMDLGPIISNITLTSSKIGLELKRQVNEVIAPANIFVDKVEVGGEMTVSASSQSDTLNDINIDTRQFEISYTFGLPKVTINSTDVQLSIYTPKQLMIPFKSYQVKEPKQPSDFSDEMNEMYKKLRKILISFRSHSKGTMARCKGKIDSARISGAKDGEELVQALIDRGVIIDTDNIMYTLDREKTGSVLGLTFDKLKSTSPTAKIKKFIEEFLALHK